VPPGIFDKLGIVEDQPLGTRAGNYRPRGVAFIPLAAWLLAVEAAGARRIESHVLGRLGDAGLRPGRLPFPLYANGKLGSNARETVVPDLARSLPVIRAALGEVGQAATVEVQLPDARIWLPPDMLIGDRWRDVLALLPSLTDPSR
jgi:hypothetical protein